MLRKEKETVQELKKTFTKPGVEVVKFEKTDVIATSTTQGIDWEEPAQGFEE